MLIADFSWPRAQMLEIAEKAHRLVVLDHHATAEAALKDLREEIQSRFDKSSLIVFDMERSGCGIVWDTFAGGPRPPIVAEVEARDLWRTDAFDPNYMANVYAAPMTFEEWDRMAATPYQQMLDDGKAITRYIHQYGTKALAEARQRALLIGPRRDLDEVWTVNMPYMNCSDYLSRLMREKDAVFVMGYFCRNDGRWQFSLRSIAPFDCSVIAKAFGGGGHAQAAGFDVASLEEVFA